ncbi:MAG: DNA-methyltransferase [Candidatus Hodarchaeota archaeon]
MFDIYEPIIYYKSSEHMEEIEDNSIQLIITSPPYGKIKDYGSDSQIGFYDSFEEYFERLKEVWKECFRVLESQCRMVINIGDQYLRTTDFGRYRILSIASRIINDCVEIGFDFLGDIIWQKVSTTNTTGGCTLMGSIYYPRNGLLTYDYEHILIFKKHQGKRKKIDLKKKELSKISLSEWKKWFIGHWTFPGVLQKEHIAMFPEELPYRVIRMFSLIGDKVLDPFVGSGTTLKVAKSLFRKGIGFELNNDFKPIIENKISTSQIGDYRDYQYLIYTLYKKSQNTNFEINYKEQRQKGIIVLQDSENREIIIDYLFIDEVINEPEFLMNEIKTKLEENTLQNYLKNQPKWESYNNYVIVLNSKYSQNQIIQNTIKKVIGSIQKIKKIQFKMFEEIVKDEFKILDLFI